MSLPQMKFIATAFVFLTTVGLFLFVLPLISPLQPFWAERYNAFFLIGLTIGGAFATLALFLSCRPVVWSVFIRRFLILFLPAILILIISALLSPKIHYLLLMGMGAYILLAFIYWVSQIRQQYYPEKGSSLFDSIQGWYRVQGKGTLLFVLLVTGIFFAFGFSNLTRFAAVDEPLWTDGRIGKFWKNIGERDWKGTRISDKPGITVALAAGTGLFFVSPQDYRDSRAEFSAAHPERTIEDFYLAFRLPLLIVITFLLPFFYVLTERLLGREIALFAYPLIALSPILVGISKIINPDALLWLLAPLSLLAYFVGLEKKRLHWFLLSGIFLGLSLLTKYVSNILFVFFFTLPFLEYLYHPKARLASLAETFKSSFVNLGVVTGIGLATFYLLFPAIWVKPEKLFTGTLYSQAFEKVAPLFLVLLVLLALDLFFLKSRGSAWLMRFLSHFEQELVRLLALVFVGSALFVLLSPQFNMPWFHFEHLLASPKSVAYVSGALGIFLTNFYPLVFGLPLITLLGFLVSGIFLMKKKQFLETPKRIAFYLMLFFLLYYIGATVNGVAMITRYQIMLYPLAGLLAGIGLFSFGRFIQERWSLGEKSFLFLPVLLAIFLSLTLFFTPFPLSYASTLLPDRYRTDVKDMGGGSYEAAMYLNSLPDAKDLLIWTDKRGVCKFFVGRCEDGFNFLRLREGGLDYIVVSSGRASRTTKMMGNPYRANDVGVIHFEEYYLRDDPQFEVKLNNRSSDYVKVFPFEGESQ